MMDPNARPDPAPRATRRRAQRLLTLLWLVGPALPLGILIIQAMLKVLGDSATQMFAWLIPTFIPTLTLLIGAMVKDQNSADEPVDGFLVRAAVGLSVVYFVLLLASVIVPWAIGTPVVKFAPISNLWLAPINGLITATLGAFIADKKP